MAAAAAVVVSVKREICQPNFSSVVERDQTGLESLDETKEDLPR